MSKNKYKSSNNKWKNIFLKKFHFYHELKLAEATGSKLVEKNEVLDLRVKGGKKGEEYNYTFGMLYNSKFTFDEYLERNGIKYNLSESNVPFLNKSNEENIVFNYDELYYFKNRYEQLEDKQHFNVNNISNYIFLPVSEITTKTKWYNKPIYEKILDISTSTTFGIGTGLAMLPVFNNSVRELEEYGVNMHSQKALFLVSTVNTMLVYSIINAINLCSFMQEYRNIENYNQNSLVKKTALLTSSIISTVLPISLLWKTELENQKVADEKGFNEFVAWATFTTLPLFICQAIESYRSLFKTVENYKMSFIELDSLGAKICTYGISLLSFIGRGVAYSSLNKFLLKEIGIKDDVAEGMSIAIGGIILNAIKGFSEFYSLQSLFEKTISKPTNIEIIKGILSTVEASWFSLPITAIGLDSYKDMNTFLKAAIFTPLFISTMVSESNNIYGTKFNQNGRNKYWDNDDSNSDVALAGHNQVE